MLSEHGHEMMVSLRDVTDRNLLQDRLRHSEKMEAIGRLAGGVAHDFNNMLTAVVGYARLAERKAAELVDGCEADSNSPGIRADLAEIRRAAAAAQHLTRQLLSLSSRHRPPTGTCDAGEILRDHARIYQAACGGLVRLRMEVEPGLPHVAAGSDLIDQVVLNLVVNARDAIAGHVAREGTGEKGVGDAEVLVTLNSVRDSSGTPMIELRVVDSGPGIPSSVRPHVFEPFFTTKSDELGSGLGLSTVYGLVTRSGGTVELRDTPGGGATFVIALPAASPAMPAAPAGAAAQATPGRRRRVLLVDDQATIRKLLARVLRAAGHEVVSAADGWAAVEQLELSLAGREPPLDAVVSDVAMPGLNGIEVARRANELFPRLPVLLMSGYTDGDLAAGVGSATSDDSPAADALEHGATREVEYRFLQKPFEPADLVRTVAELATNGAGRKTV